MTLGRPSVQNHHHRHHHHRHRRRRRRRRHVITGTPQNSGGI